MAAERRRVEKELPRQTHAAWLPPHAAQATPSAGRRAATRKSRFRTARRRASDTPSSTDDEQREPAFRASVAAHLRCRIIARPGCCAHGGCPLARPGPAKLPCAAAARPRPTMPAPDATAEPRRSSQRRATMRGAAAAIATPSGPPRSFVTASERPARRHASLRGQAAPAPGAE